MQRELRWIEKGKLQAIERPGSTDSGPCLVLFHGYGADADDLAGLAPYLQGPDTLRLLFPRGPIEIEVAPGYTGRAWMHIDRKRLEQSLQVGKVLDLKDHRPPEMTAIRNRILPWIQELIDQHSAVVLGGFSQGAMLATELSTQRKPAALVVLSGNLVDEKGWSESMEGFSEFPVFLSHGENDQILGLDGARNLVTLLESKGANVESYYFRGGHEIPPKVIEKLNQFLRTFWLIRKDKPSL